MFVSMTRPLVRLTSTSHSSRENDYLATKANKNLLRPSDYNIVLFVCFVPSGLYVMIVFVSANLSLTLMAMLILKLSLRVVRYFITAAWEEGDCSLLLGMIGISVSVMIHVCGKSECLRLVVFEVVLLLNVVIGVAVGRATIKVKR